jgi:hypothetical protein
MLNSISSKTHRLLERLDRVKPAGQGKWLACCPAHDDRSPSLAIREADDRILIHCFAGCSLAEVLGAVGIEMVDLFPDRPADPYAPKAKLSRFRAYELFPLLVQESVILALAWNEVLNKGALTDTDLLRANQAYECVMRLHAEVSR